MSGLFNITDADIQASLQIIESHASTMRQTISHVEGIGGNIGAAYRSTTSTQFQSQLTEWGQIYGELMSAVQRVQDDLNQANRGITQAHEQSGQQVSTLSGSISGILAG